MQKLTILFFLILLSGIVKSQNIYSALHLNEEREYKSRKPKKIVETNIFFNPSGKQIDKQIKTLDDAGMLVTEERYDNNGSLTARLTYTNDTINRIKLSRVFERWTHLGYSKTTAFYHYDKNFFLIGVTDKNANGDVIQQTNLICNDNGHPIELSLYDGNGNSYDKETAKYLYDKNKAITSVVANDGRILSVDTMKISFTAASKFPYENEIYNANGDLTSRTSRNLNGSEIILEGEYAYDNFGNCTEHKIFKVTVKKNGKKKRENDKIYKKEYFY